MDTPSLGNKTADTPTDPEALENSTTTNIKNQTHNAVQRRLIPHGIKLSTFDKDISDEHFLYEFNRQRIFTLEEVEKLKSLRQKIRESTIDKKSLPQAELTQIVKNALGTELTFFYEMLAKYRQTGKKTFPGVSQQELDNAFYEKMGIDSIDLQRHSSTVSVMVRNFNMSTGSAPILYELLVKYNPASNILFHLTNFITRLYSEYGIAESSGYADERKGLMSIDLAALEIIEFCLKNNIIINQSIQEQIMALHRKPPHTGESAKYIVKLYKLYGNNSKKCKHVIDTVEDLYAYWGNFCAINLLTSLHPIYQNDMTAFDKWAIRIRNLRPQNLSRKENSAENKNWEAFTRIISAPFNHENVNVYDHNFSFGTFYALLITLPKTDAEILADRLLEVAQTIIKLIDLKDDFINLYSKIWHGLKSGIPIYIKPATENHPAQLSPTKLDGLIQIFLDTLKDYPNSPSPYWTYGDKLTDYIENQQQDSLSLEQVQDYYQKLLTESNTTNTSAATPTALN